jgi:TonB family protein
MDPLGGNPLKRLFAFLFISACFVFAQDRPEVFDVVELSKNPLQWKGHSGVLTGSLSEVKFNKMLNEHTALYEIVSPDMTLKTETHVGEIALLIPDNNPPRDTSKPWRVEVVDPLKVANEIGIETQVTALKFLGYDTDQSEDKPRGIGPGVHAPEVISHVDPQFPELSKKDRRKLGSGICLVSLIVDRNGNPQEVHISKSLSPELDAYALKSVSQYRFKPAMFQGNPIPVKLTVEVNFRIK